jgi:hypothetical protein
MTEQEKELLLKDLCARLPYGTMVSVDNGKYREDMKLRPYHIAAFNNWDVKPYLRPLASMTEEEKRELSKKYVWDINCGQIEIRYHSDGYWDDNIECPTSEYLNLFDWLNAHHFDYRGLIKKGLALEAPEGMY